MTVMQRERDRWRPKWRLLTAAAFAAIGGGEAERRALDQLARAARDWITPTPARGETLLCAALFNLARAFADPDGNADWRAAMAPCLRGLAEAVGDTLDATDPAEPAQPARRYRADIDG